MGFGGWSFFSRDAETRKRTEQLKQAEARSREARGQCEKMHNTLLFMTQRAGDDLSFLGEEKMSLYLQGSVARFARLAQDLDCGEETYTSAMEEQIPMASALKAAADRTAFFVEVSQELDKLAFGSVGLLLQAIGMTSTNVMVPLLATEGFPGMIRRLLDCKPAWLDDGKHLRTELWDEYDALLAGSGALGPGMFRRRTVQDADTALAETNGYCERCKAFISRCKGRGRTLKTMYDATQEFRKTIKKADTAFWGQLNSFKKIVSHRTVYAMCSSSERSLIQNCCAFSECIENLLQIDYIDKNGNVIPGALEHIATCSHVIDELCQRSRA